MGGGSSAGRALGGIAGGMFGGGIFGGMKAGEAGSNVVAGIKDADQASIDKGTADVAESNMTEEELQSRRRGFLSLINSQNGSGGITNPMLNTRKGALGGF